MGSARGSVMGTVALWIVVALAVAAALYVLLRYVLPLLIIAGFGMFWVAMKRWDAWHHRRKFERQRRRGDQ